MTRKAIKSHDGKCRLDLIPTPAMRGMADAFEAGLKNGRQPFDWLKGADWSLYIAGVKRHVTEFEERRDIDPDDGVHHLFKAMAGLAILSMYSELKLGNDDRPRYPGVKVEPCAGWIQVYVAGAYSSDNVLGVLRNMGRGIQASKDVLKAGFAPYCPWLDYQYVLVAQDDEDLTLDAFYQYSMAWLDVSKAMLVLPNSENSKGTQAEIARAKELGIPILGSLKALIDWRDRGVHA